MPLTGGLQAFRGIGLAVSDDLWHWTRTLEDPVLLGDGFPEWPGNKGIAGGGRILEIPQTDGTFTGCTTRSPATATNEVNIGNPTRCKT